MEPGAILGRMGLIGHKHIPHEYLANSREVRMELLAGLIDSDGYYYASSKAYDITQKDEHLAKQIKYLADTLGFRAILSRKRATIKDRGYVCDVWLVRIIGNVDQIPVLIQRKKAEPRRINKDWRVCGVAIEADGEDEYFGFTIDGDGLFLLEDCTVTHNTIYCESIAEHWARKRNRVTFVHYELNRALMMDRRTARHTSITYHELRSGKLTPAQRAQIASVRDTLLSWDGCITYVHTPSWTMERTTAELRKLHADGLCDVVVLDYLEKAAASQRQVRLFSGNPYQREADNVEQLKNFAEAVGIPVLMVTQMTKDGKKQSSDEMDRTNMRGAGEKSEKANLVVLLSRKKLPKNEIKEDGNRYSNIVDVVIDKATVGANSSFQQVMQPEFYRVGDEYKPGPA